MTVREVAELAQVGEATVRHWIKAGDLRALDLGREFRIIPRDLEAFLERHATGEAIATGKAEGEAHATSPGPSSRTS